MFQSPLANLIADFNRQLCAQGSRYVLLYVDANAVGELSLRCSSNYPAEHIGPLLGSMLEPSERLRLMLSDLFKAHPMQLPDIHCATCKHGLHDGTCGLCTEEGRCLCHDGKPALVEVPTEQAVEMVLAAIFTNLQLKGAKQASPIVLLG